MGGCCCCASQRAESDRTPIYILVRSSQEENEALPAPHATSAAIPAGLFVDTNLNTSSPDTYQAPPAPLPYDVGLPCSQNVSGNTGLTEVCGNKTDSVRSIDSLPESEDLKGIECISKSNDIHDSFRVKDDISKLKDAEALATNEEDVCPICLEEYEAENPRIITKCEHHFHLACILEWMERSNSCPICDQITIIDHTYEE